MNLQRNEVCRRAAMSERKGSPLVVIGAALLFALSSGPSHGAIITFQTEAGRPRIVSSVPQQNATSILTNATFQITFDQPMNEATLNATNVKLVDLSTGLLHANWLSAPITTTATTFATTSSVGLTSNTAYALVLTTGVRSLSGQSLDPTDPRHRSATLFGEAWVIEFVTGSSLPSTSIASTTIGNVTLAGGSGGQTNVPIDAVIRVNFERAMLSSSINTTNVTLKKTATQAPVTISVSYDSVSNTAVITPTAPLEYSTGYTLTLTGLADVLGNPLP